jgi:MerR family transcriptional regulator, glutamine synthetase repressor
MTKGVGVQHLMDLNERRQLPLFSIGTVEKLTGLTARQIRYYEEHALITPARSKGKQRLFSFEDVERLMLIRQWMDEGHNMAGVKRNFAEVSRRAEAKSAPAPTREPSDIEMYQWLQRELMDGPTGKNSSMFQGDLSRFYRRR